MKKKPHEYRRNAHSVTLINYHFVWCPKRRKPILKGEIRYRLQEILFELSTENNWQLKDSEIMPDHVHLFLEVDPIALRAGVVTIKGDVDVDNQEMLS